MFLGETTKLKASNAQIFTTPALRAVTFDETRLLQVPSTSLVPSKTYLVKVFPKEKKYLGKLQINSRLLAFDSLG